MRRAFRMGRALSRVEGRAGAARSGAARRGHQLGRAEGAGLGQALGGALAVAAGRSDLPGSAARFAMLIGCTTLDDDGT